MESGTLSPNQYASEVVNKTFIAIIASAIIGSAIVAILVLYVLCWRHRQMRLRAAEPMFDLLNPRSASELGTPSGTAELAAGANSIRMKRRPQLSTYSLSALFPRGVYELDGEGVVPRAVPVQGRRNSWFQSFMRGSMVPTDSEPRFKENHSLKSCEQASGSKNEALHGFVGNTTERTQHSMQVEQWDDLAKLPLRSPSVDMHLDTASRASSNCKMGRSSSPNPRVFNVSRTWENLRVPVNPISYDVVETRDSAEHLPSTQQHCEDTWI